MKKLKLTNLNESALSSNEMHNLNGGGGCGCGCFYAGRGGSSSHDNGTTNSHGSLVSIGDGPQDIYVTAD